MIFPPLPFLQFYCSYSSGLHVSTTVKDVAVANLYERNHPYTALADPDIEDDGMDASEHGLQDMAKSDPARSAVPQQQPYYPTRDPPQPAGAQRMSSRSPNEARDVFSYPETEFSAMARAGDTCDRHLLFVSVHNDIALVLCLKTYQK